MNNCEVDTGRSRTKEPAPNIALPNRGGLSLLQIPGKAAVAFFQRFAANRYVEFVHPAVTAQLELGSQLQERRPSCKSLVAVPRRPSHK
jgi:hypothetical protein